MPRKPRKNLLVSNPNLNVFEDAVTREPVWLQQPRESGKAYAGFVLFRDLGLGRKKVSVMAEMDKGKSQVEGWARRWCWNKRAAAYDAHVEGLAITEFEEERKRMARRQANLGMQMQSRAESALSMLQDDDMTASDVAKLATEGVKIERLARGETTGDEGQSITIVYGAPKPKWAPDALKPPPKELPVEIVPESEVGEEVLEDETDLTPTPTV